MTLVDIWLTGRHSAGFRRPDAAFPWSTTDGWTGRPANRRESASTFLTPTRQSAIFAWSTDSRVDCYVTSGPFGARDSTLPPWPAQWRRSTLKTKDTDW